MTTALANGDEARVLELLLSEGSASAIQECAQRGKAALLARVLESSVPHDAAVLAKALWFAATNGHLETVKVLLAHQADPNGFVRHKKTARATARDGGHAAIVDALQKAGGKLRT